MDVTRLRKLILAATPGPLEIHRFDNVSDINYQLQSTRGGMSEHEDYAVIANIRDDACPRAKATAELILELYNRAEEFAALQDYLSEVREGYHALDRNWDRVHNTAMGAIRSSLDMPDATVPELCQRIKQAMALAEAGRLMREAIDHPSTTLDGAMCEAMENWDRVVANLVFVAVVDGVP